MSHTQRLSISILIITYNREHDLLELLETINNQEKAGEILKEILILDNASTTPYTDTIRFVQEHPHLKINFIASDENLGVSRGRNKLMQIAKGDWLLILDDDIIFREPDGLSKIAAYPLKPFFRENNTAVITPRVIYYDTKEVQITAFPHKSYESYKDKKQFLTFYYTGCAHLMKRSILAETGIYPTDFFYGMEEYDLAYRILDAGYSIGYDNEVTFEHKESPLGRQPNHVKLKQQWVNKSKVAWRYLPLIYFITTALAWSFQYLKKAGGQPATFFTGWKSIFSIPFRESRKVINSKALIYLKEVNARLWY